jgi:hypothetical protein
MEPRHPRKSHNLGQKAARQQNSPSPRKTSLFYESQCRYFDFSPPITSFMHNQSTFLSLTEPKNPVRRKTPTDIEQMPGIKNVRNVLKEGN